MLLSVGKSITNFLNLLKNKTEAFFYGKLYPVILALTSFLFWVANLQYISLSILVAFGSFILIVYDDMLPTIPLLFTIPMSFRDTTVFNSQLTPYLYLIPAAIAFIIHFMRFQRKPKFDALCIGFLAIIVAMLLGGSFSDYTEDYKYGFSYLLLSGIAMLAVHFVYSNRITTGKRYNVGKYTCFAILVAANLACLQLVYAKHFNPSEFIFPGFCWANTNHIGYLILIAVPACCYLLLDAKNIYLYVLNLIFFYVSVFITESDGSIFILILSTPLLLYYTLNKAPKKNYQSLKLTYLIIIPLVILTLSCLVLFNLETITNFFHKAANDNGRTDLYSMLFDLFKESPLFGVGIGHTIVFLPDWYNGYCHSTFFFAIATTGIFGLLAYGIFYTLRFRLLSKNNTTLGVFITLSFVMFALYSLIDNGEFNVVLIYITALITCVGVHNNKKGNGDEPLPITKQFSFYPLRSNVDFV